MKTLLTIALLAIATNIMADTNYIAFVYDEDLKHPDKTIEKSNSKELFNDATEVAWDDMARFQSIADPAIKYRVVCYAVDVGTVQKKDITKDKAEKDVKDKLAQKSKCTVVACGMNPRADLALAGYEPAPSETP